MTAGSPAAPLRRSRRLQILYAALAAVFALMLMLPSIVEWRVNAMLAKIAARGNASARIIHSGLFHTDASLVLHGEERRGPASARISSLSVEYSPIELLRGRIGSISVNGVSASAVYTNGVFSVPALSIFTPAALHGKGEDPQNRTGAPMDPFETLRNIPFSVGRIQISGQIWLTADSERMSVPFFIHAETGDRGFRDGVKIRASATLNSSGVFVTAHINAAEETISSSVFASVSSDSIPISLRSGMPASVKSASADLKCESVLAFSGAMPANISAEASANIWADTSSGIFELHPAVSISGPASNASVKITGLDTAIFGIPLSVSVEDGVLDIAETSFSSSVKAAAGPAGCVFDTKINRSGFSISGRDSHQPGAEFPLGQNYALKCGTVSLQADGSFTNLTGTACAELDGWRVMPREGRRKNNSAPTASSGKISVLAEFSPDGASIKAGAPDIDMSGLLKGLGASFSAAARTGKTSGQATANGGMTLLAKLGGAVPLRSHTEFQASGSCICAQTAISAAGVDATLQTSVRAGIVSNAFTITNQRIDPDAIAGLLPAAKGLSAGGTVDAQAYFVSGGGIRQNGSFSIRLSDGFARWEQHAFSVSNIVTSFSMPALPALTSETRYLGFKDLRFKDIHIDSGAILYRMQSPDRWFADNISVDWCGGKLRTGSIILPPDFERGTRITLHCDRIGLAQMLEQFGVAKQASGQGQLSGVIPLSIKNRKLYVNDGYLYSAPGETGTLNITPTDELQSMSQASGEMSLAVDSLSNFEYSWLRTDITCEGGDLKLRLRFDGKPANPLPYTLDGGSVVKIKGKSVFQGVNLDMSVNIPVNDILPGFIPARR